MVHSVSTSLSIFERMKNCIWFISSCQCIKEASRHWVFSGGGRNPSSPAEVSSHLRLGLSHWQSILSQGILPLRCVSSVGHRSLPLLFLEVFQDPSVPLSAPSLHACEQGSESHGVSRCLRQIQIIPGGRQHRHMYPEHLVHMDVQIQDSHFFVQLPPTWLVHYGAIKYPIEFHIPGGTWRPERGLLLSRVYAEFNLCYNFKSQNWFRYQWAIGFIWSSWAFSVNLTLASVVLYCKKTMILFLQKHTLD